MSKFVIRPRLDAHAWHRAMTQACHILRFARVLFLDLTALSLSYDHGEQADDVIVRSRKSPERPESLTG
ncbi:hypothetical protein ACFPOB_25200 [Bosea eneae]|uniref:Uncharacterized protein n=1 Tax=Bosea eneae TaxID=151454 RepID=A0ABW0IXA5_9HYPH